MGGLGLLAAIGAGGGYWVWQLNDQVAKADREIAALRTSIEQFATQAELQALTGRHDKLQQQVDATVPVDIGRIDAALAGLRTDLDAITIPNVTPVLARLSALEDKVGKWQPTDLTTLEASVAALRADLTVAQGTLNTVKVGMDDFVSTTDLEALDHEMQRRLGEGLAASAEEVGKLESQLAEAITTTTGRLHEFRVLVTGLEQRQAALEAQQAGMATLSAVDALDGRVGALEKVAPPNLTAVLAELATTRAEIKTLDGRLDDWPKPDATLAGKVDELTTLIGGIPARVGLLETGLRAVETAVGGLATTVDLETLRAHVDKVCCNGTGKTAKLVAQVYFDRSSVALSDIEKDKIAAVAAQLSSDPRDLAILGFADTQGPPEYNRTLSLRRATAVRKALVDLGIEAAVVTSIDGLGEDGPPIPTDDDSPEQSNRTVLIYGYY